MIKHLKEIIITILVLSIVAFVCGFIVARGQYAPEPVSSQTLLRAMQNEGFFVTESIILEETITIDNRTGNALRDFFVSENIEAAADLRVAMGFDTTLLSAEDLRIDGKTIQVVLPAVSIFSTEVLGDVDIDTQRGIISRVTSGEEDYNGLVAILKEQARVSVTDPDIAAAVQLGTIDTVTRFLTTLAPTYTPVITFES